MSVLFTDTWFQVMVGLSERQIINQLQESWTMSKTLMCISLKICKLYKIILQTRFWHNFDTSRHKKNQHNPTPASEFPESPQFKFQIEKLIYNQVNFVACCSRTRTDHLLITDLGSNNRSRLDVIARLLLTCSVVIRLSCPVRLMSEVRWPTSDERWAASERSQSVQKKRPSP